MTLSALELAQTLIRCPSVTPVEGGALVYLETILKEAGFATERMTFSDSDTPDVQNLYARIGTEAPYLLFAGHTDVVPPGEVTSWSHGPFSGDIIDDKLYGRGAVDMKGGIAAFVAATLAHLKENGLPRGSIGFLITGDEEGPAINGTPKLLEWATARGEKFDHCILGEPTNPNALGDMIKIGRRGSLSAIITVDGQQGHVAYPHLAANPIPLLVDIVARLTAKPLDQGNTFFDASNLEITSIDVGNAAMNVIPARAVAKLNIRFNDEHTVDSLKAWISGIVAARTQDKVTASVQFGRAPSASFITKPGAFVDLISSTIEETTGKTPVLSTSGGTSDARFIKDYCPVIEFGLVGQTMHKVDEHVAVPDLAQLTTIYRRMIERYFGNG